jgi:hypothetical protein
MIYAEGDRLYEVDDGATRVFDISTPYNPVLLTEYEGGCEYSGTAVIRDQTAFLGRQDTLFVVDLSIPGDPVELTQYNLRGSIKGVAIEGATLYVSYDDPLFNAAALEVLDVSDPSSPSFVSRRAFQSGDLEAGPVSASGALLAIGLVAPRYYDYVEQVLLVDVSDRGMPRARGTYEYGDDSYSSEDLLAISLTGGTLQVLGTKYDYSEVWNPYYLRLRMVVVDVSDPTDPAPIGVTDLGPADYEWTSAGLLTEGP